jgi:hypothetical protein
MSPPLEKFCLSSRWLNLVRGAILCGINTSAAVMKVFWDYTNFAISQQNKEPMVNNSSLDDFGWIGGSKIIMTCFRKTESAEYLAMIADENQLETD